MKYPLFILIISFVTTSYAQTYQYVPIPTSNAEWKAQNPVDYQSGHGSPAGYVCYSWKHSFLGRDTIIGTDTLHNIRAVYYYDNDCKDVTFNTIREGAKIAGTVWMMERDKKIYLTKTLPLDTSITVPYLDFNLSYVGERLPSPWVTDTVISIDTVPINGQLRRRIVILTHHNILTTWGLVDTLIEGIGSTRFGLGFDELYNPGADYQNRCKLYCFSANGQAEYVRDNSACMDVWPTGVEDFTAYLQPSLNPNPFNDKLAVNLLGRATIRVYNLLGVSVYSGTFSCKQEAVVNTTDWRSGLYIVIIEHNGISSTQKMVKL